MTDRELLDCLTDRPCQVCKFNKEDGCCKWECVFDRKKPTDEICIINDDGTVYNAIPKFIEQLKIKDMDRQYNAGIVCEKDGNYIIGYEMRGAEETFSIGQPVYDKDKNIMGWLGIGLFENLDYSAKIRVPCEYWQICLPTKFCEVGKQVYTYFQMTGVEPQERSDKE